MEALVTSLSIRERGRMSGILVITNEDDSLKINCTLGVIVALGTDPFLVQEGLALGKVVSFSRHAGNHRYVEGRRYRVLEFQELQDIQDEMPSDAKLLSQVEEETFGPPLTRSSPRPDGSS